MAPERMNGQVTVQSWSLSVPVRGAGFGQRVAGLFLGTGFTFALFLGIAHYEKEAPQNPPPPLDDLRVALRPVEIPPPLPVKPVESVPDLTPMAGFVLSPAQSPVKIAVSPPDLSAMLPEDLSKAPQANARLGPMLTEFKPKMVFLADPQHIYQKNEVDRAPYIVDRPDMQWPSRMLNGKNAPRVTLLVVVDANGSSSNIRIMKSSGDAEIDAMMIQYIKECVFSPAVKKSKQVRCMIEQTVSLQQPSRSRFGL